MSLAKNKLLIMGGTRLSTEIIQKAQSMGIFVLVSDYLENSPGKRIADESFMVSTRDVEGLVDLIINEKVDGVLTGFIDSLLPYYQKVCEITGLPCYGTKEQFDILPNKAKFKKLCRDFKIPVVEEFSIDYPLSHAQVDALPFPVLVKPVDYSGARGVYVCENNENFMSNYEKSLSFSPSRTLLIEKYIDSKEIHIHYLIQNGQFSLAAVADRHMSTNNVGYLRLPVAYTYPSKYIHVYEKNLNNKVIEMLQSIGIQNGIILLQGFVENENFTLYEIAFRLNGTLEYKIINEICGVNPLEMLINFALTGSMYQENINDLIDADYNKYGFSLAFSVKPGKIGEISGLQEIEELDGIIDIVSFYDEGDEVPESASGTLSQIIFRISGTADTEEAMRSRMNMIINLINVESFSGESMLVYVFDTTNLY